MNRNLIFFTIISKNYLSYARTLFKSLKRFYPDYRFFVCLADTTDSYFDPKKEIFEVVEAKRLSIPDFERFAFRYDIVEFNTAVKPFMFKWLFENTGTDSIIYLDPDIFVLSKLNEVEKLLSEGSMAVITPHTCDPIEDNESPNEIDMLRAGIFNLGFIAVRRCDDALKFIGWWAEKLIYDCRIDLESGLFVDQKWIDLLPSLFNNVTILRHSGYNVAYWNLMNRNIEKVKDDLYSNGKRLTFFHFSGIDLANRNKFSKYQSRFNLQNLGNLRELYLRYIKRLKEEGYRETSQWPYAYATFSNGEKILKPMRILLSKEFLDSTEKIPADPFKLDLNFFNAPALELPNDKDLVITQLMHSVWKSRKDLQQAFNITTYPGRVSFCEWFFSSAQLELGLSKSFIVSARPNEDVQTAQKSLGYSLIQFIVKYYKVFKPVYRHFDPQIRIKIKRLIFRHLINKEYLYAQNVARSIDQTTSNTENTAVSSKLFLQTFWKKDNESFIEKRSCLQYLILDNEREFDVLINIQCRATQLRIDFADNEEIYKLTLLEVETANGLIAIDFHKTKLETFNLARNGNEFHVTGDDPQITLSLPGKFVDISSLHFQGKVLGINEQVHTNIHENNNEIKFKKGVNLLGYPKAEIGMGEHVRLSAKSMLQTGVDFVIYDFGAGETNVRENDLRYSKHIYSHNPYGTNIFHINADQMEFVINSHGKSFIENRYNIGYWAWELSKFPKIWRISLDLVNEIWAPSRFIQTAISEISFKPVVHMPIAVDFPPPNGIDRKHFGLPENSFIFLFSFDFGSYLTRKNPYDCIKAFKQAFPNKQKPVVLVLKFMREDNDPSGYKRLKEEIGNDPRIIFINNVLLPSEVLSLAKVSDCFISLHRSEGFGRCIAESMLLGKPVIATNYSGNTDYMFPDNSCPVNFELISLKKGEYPFGDGQVWANPDIENAAWYMQRVFEDEVYRKKISLAGKEYIKKEYNSRVIGDRYKQRLKLLGLI